MPSLFLFLLLHCLSVVNGLSSSNLYFQGLEKKLKDLLKSPGDLKKYTRIYLRTMDIYTLRQFLNHSISYETTDYVCTSSLEAEEFKKLGKSCTIFKGDFVYKSAEFNLWKSLHSIRGSAVFEEPISVMESQDLVVQEILLNRDAKFVWSGHVFMPLLNKISTVKNHLHGAMDITCGKQNHRCKVLKVIFLEEYADEQKHTDFHLKEQARKALVQARGRRRARRAIEPSVTTSTTQQWRTGTNVEENSTKSHSDESTMGSNYEKDEGDVHGYTASKIILTGYLDAFGNLVFDENDLPYVTNPIIECSNKFWIIVTIVFFGGIAIEIIGIIFSVRKIFTVKANIKSYKEELARISFEKKKHQQEKKQSVMKSREKKKLQEKYPVPRNYKSIGVTPTRSAMRGKANQPQSILSKQSAST